MCDIRWCKTGKEGTVPVNEIIDDGSYRVSICDSCAAAIGVKSGEDLPEPAVVEKLLHENAKPRYDSVYEEGVKWLNTL